MRSAGHKQADAVHLSPWLSMATDQNAGGKSGHTGCLGRQRSCLVPSSLEILGRIDHQVKIRGFRIELGEIETALVGHAQVEEAIVLAKPGPDGAGGQRLLAYVLVGEDALCEPGSEQALALTATLRAHLALSLPDYMVPAVFVPLARWPLTPNGKVDRHALPVPDGAPSQTRYVAPRTPTEHALCVMWQEVLGVAQVGIEDNFFELGGHSLMAMKLLTQLEQHFQLELSVKTIFQFPDLQALAAYFDVMDPGTGSGNENDASFQGGEEIETFEL